MEFYFIHWVIIHCYHYLDSRIVLDLASRAASNCVLLTCPHDSWTTFFMAHGNILFFQTQLVFSLPLIWNQLFLLRHVFL